MFCVLERLLKHKAQRHLVDRTNVCTVGQGGVLIELLLGYNFKRLRNIACVLI